MNKLAAVGMVCFLAALAGCGAGTVKEEVITVKKQDPMDQVRATLQNYVNGQPLGSEVTSYDYMIEEVKKTDPAKADVLKAGLDELKNAKTGQKEKAKDLMKKLNLEDKK